MTHFRSDVISRDFENWRTSIKTNCVFIIWRAVCFKIIFLGWSSTFCFRCMPSVETHTLIGNCRHFILIYPTLLEKLFKLQYVDRVTRSVAVGLHDKFLLSFVKFWNVNQFSRFLVRLCTHNCISWVYINRSVLKRYPISYTHKSLPVLRVIS